ncbi:CAP domain-containing protein [Streptomyces sp. enrichment culture]|uniref:CAP domain-containing protein n=1 Tax=Streptomyces sp. enrichment culture TaxID=1795815 RepID=UPI003F563B9D
MGRHRRSAAGRATTGRATGVVHHDGSRDGARDPLGARTDGPPTMGIAPYLNPEAYAGTYARSEAYLFGTDDGAGTLGTAVLAGDDFPGDGLTGGPADGPFPGDDFTAGPARGSFPDGRFPDDGFTPDGGARGAGGHRRRKKKAAAPVRTGLLGVSAAVALGTVAVATGAVPGLENYRLGGDSTSSDEVQAGGLATNLPSEQGGTSGSAETPGRDAGTPAGRESGRPASPEPSESAPASTAPTKAPEKKAPEKKAPEAPPSGKPEKTPSRKAEPEPEKKPDAPAASSAEAVAGARVLALVNEERARAGCSPVTASGALTDLATAFSEDMARRGFFDHTDPDGDTPWDRAQAAGVNGLGGENIARGQADAEAVMRAWMDSPGHKANILNCDFRTLGVGVHFGPGGPWWTQNFGY